MFVEEKTNLDNTYKNPFEDYNANVLEPERIVEYWCNPFSQGLLTNIDEYSFRTNKMPIILQGSRGSGKTMILKYYSYKAQIVRSVNNKTSLLNTIKKEGEVGFYCRYDETFIKTFKRIFEKVDHDNWIDCFDYYLELDLSQKILDMLVYIVEQEDLSFENESRLVKDLIGKIGIENQHIDNSLSGMVDFVSKQIAYINRFKKNYVYTKESFNPTAFLDLYEMSSTLVLLIKEHIPTLKSTNFVLLFDEFENLPEELQKRINTLIKFSNENISIRVGRRSEVNVSNETINSSEYLRENHDYTLASLDKEYDNKTNSNIADYFLEISKKRFVSIQAKDDKSDLVYMLGEKENLDEECAELCNGKKLHVEAVLCEEPEIKKDEQLLRSIVETIKNDENPIAETLNALWVIRATSDYLGKAQETAKTMEDFFSKIKSEETKKYSSDYTNKYRYAITVLICSVYRKPKLYYSFNDVCYLANGNTRTFINMCREIINDALFYEKKSFLASGKISKETQSRAIHNFSNREFGDICAIIQYGDRIGNFILNIGNYFAAYHKDKKIRYPETNQFVIDELSLEENDRKVVKVAESWAMIVKKEKAQRITAGVNKQGYIYHINRVFCPIFNISYRTRGGFNLTLSSDTVHTMINENDCISVDIIDKEEQKKKPSKKRKKADSNDNDGQMSFVFEYAKGDDNE